MGRGCIHKGEERRGIDREGERKKKGVRLRRQREEDEGEKEGRVYKQMLSQGQGVKGKERASAHVA